MVAGQVTVQTEGFGFWETDIIRWGISEGTRGGGLYTHQGAGFRVQVQPRPAGSDPWAATPYGTMIVVAKAPDSAKWYTAAERATLVVRLWQRRPDGTLEAFLNANGGIPSTDQFLLDPDRTFLREQQAVYLVPDDFGGIDRVARITAVLSAAGSERTVLQWDRGTAPPEEPQVPVEVQHALVVTWGPGGVGPAPVPPPVPGNARARAAGGTTAFARGRRP